MNRKAWCVIAILFIIAIVFGYVVGSKMCEGITYNEKALVKELN